MPERRHGEHDLQEGTRLLDRYTILDRIGSGGMATIYRASDDRLDRVVCVKLLRRTLVEGSGSTSGRAVYEATYAHFLQEALALSKLSHPNTLRIYDFGYVGEDSGDRGAPFHVSEYLDGGNVESHVRLRGSIAPVEALGILEAVTGAVVEAHDHGIIHRDIKPSNILFARISGDLVPKLADFGIARSSVTKGESGETVSPVALFSPRWAAPEQLCGAPEGPRTDVYALGLLVAFMLSGKVMFGDDDVRETFNDRVRGDTLVRARVAQMGLGGEVGDVLVRAMRARPDDRTQTPTEFVQGLRPVLNRASAPSAPPPLRADPPPSGHVPQLPPESTGSLSLEVPGSPVPRELVSTHAARRVRFVEVRETLDLSFLDALGGLVRLRVTMLPSGGSINVKGLTCFVARRGQRPTPAVTLTHDGSIDLLSTSRQLLGELTCSFGQPGPTERLFVVDGRQLLVPYSDAQQAITLMVSPGQDLVVMCRR